MDDRQTKIREGAGLEDSRVNQEFIDFLNKWSSPVLLTLAVAALIYAGMQYLERQKIARIDQAFSEFESATTGANPSPASLKTLADEYSGVRSVPELALLTTSDIYLNAFVVGFRPGAETNPNTGELINEADLLDETQRKVYLEQAGDMAQQVLDLTKDATGKELIAMQAYSRLAAVKEGMRDFDGAKAQYQSLETLATKHFYESIASFATNRIESLEEIKLVSALPSDADLTPLTGEEQLGTDGQQTISPEQLQEMMDAIQNSTPEIDQTDDLDIPTGDEESAPETDPAVQPETTSDTP
ncbi:MAG: hypothetical protein P1U42_09930 [Phycisphaerales bacterium]|nr:hypothetical protein [Phycisphaerales bacterium]